MSRRYPEKVPVTFKDVAAYFCEDEWKLLQESQKKFYKKVMKEIHQVLITLGYKIRNPDNLIRVTKREDLHIWEPHEPLRRTNNESPSFCHPTVFPDILLRIKQESGSYCGNWSSDEELEISSSSSKADDGTANRGVLHKRKQEAKLSLDDSVDEGAIKTEDTLAFTDVGKKIKREEKGSFKNSCEKKASRNTEDTIANASILQTIKREEKLSLLDSVDAEEGRSKADLHSADDPFEDSDIPHKRKREERLCLNDSQDTEARGNKDGVGKEFSVANAEISWGKEEEESEAYEGDNADHEEMEQRNNSNLGYEIISFPIKEEEEDYPLNHPYFQSRERNSCPTGFGAMKRKMKSRDSINSHQETIQGEGSEQSPDFDSIWSNSDIITLQLNTEHQRGAYVCGECDRSFGLKGSLIQHLRSHSGPHQCTKCEKSFSLKRNLKRHQRTHIEENERRYRCNECEKTFCQKDSLVKHKRTHTGERPFQCTECDKRFTVRVNLITHQRIHSSDRPYQCTQCDKSFTQKAHLIGHEAKHTGVRPYKCTKCEKSYSFQGSLIRHQITHTGNGGPTKAAKDKSPKAPQI